MAQPGRPTKYSRAIHAAIVTNLEAGMSRTTAAELAGIARQTLNDWAGMPPDWQGKYPTFSHDVRTAIARAKARATVTITKAIREGDVQAAFRYLALQEREEWGERKQVDVNVEIRQLAERIAAESGVDADELMAEAERIAAGAWGTA